MLHEPSFSSTVRALAERQFSGGRASLTSSPLSALTVGCDELAALDPEVILTAHIGVPQVLQDAVARFPHPPTLVVADIDRGSATRQQMFRASARLALPQWPVDRLVVAAAVVRPAVESVELVALGPHRWPDEATEAIRDLERIIHAHVDQWRPPRAIWDAPAEVLLPEVLETLSGATGR